MEVPALVLDSDDKPWKHIDPKQFDISIDMAPKFRPSYVRLQGDDPISLSILFDVSGDISTLVPALREAIPALVPGSLHADDNISFYALDCHLVRSLDDVPASTAGLQAAFDAAMAHPGLHGDKKLVSGCIGTSLLRDSIEMLTDRLAKLPGRKMLLLISSGEDGNDTVPWPRLRTFAATAGVSIFAMTTPSSAFSSNYAAGDELRILCHGTGGVMLQASSARKAAEMLPRFFELMRGRYVLEFHRPADAKGGLHRLSVTLGKTHAQIHVGGTSVPLATDAERATPQITPAGPARAPVNTPPPTAAPPQL